MKIKIIILVAVACLFLQLIAETSAKASLTVRANIKSDKPVFVGVLNENQYRKIFADEQEDEKGVYTREYRVNSRVLSAAAGLTIADLPAGKYAVILYVDKNGNGDFDEGMLGPAEPWGMSRLEKGVILRAPEFNEVAFTIGEGESKQITVKLVKE